MQDQSKALRLFSNCGIILIILATAGKGLAVDYATIIRKLSKSADDIPVTRIDDVIANKRTSEAGADLIRRQAKSGVDLSELNAIRRRALDGLDPVTIRQIDSLPSDAKDAIYLVSSGTKKMREAIPDIALRGEFLRDGGGDLLAMLGRRGDLAGDAVELRNYLKNGRLPSLPGGRPITLNDWARFMESNPSRGDYFWNTYWKGKEKYWLGTAGLAAVLLTPEEYLDDAGKFLEKGVNKLGGIVGEAIAKIVEVGTTVVVEKPFKGFWKGLISNPWSLLPVGLVFAAGGLYLAYWRKHLKSLVQGVISGKPIDNNLPK
jgi:hypothetical protein